MSYGAQDLKAEINGIIADLNTKITAMRGVIQFAEETGSRLTALHTNHIEIINAGAQLGRNGTVQQHMNDSINALVALIRALEYYRDYVV